MGAVTGDRTTAEPARSHAADGMLLVRDVLDAQLETADARRVGRVADLLATWDEDGLHVCEILVGPQPLAGRVSYRLRTLAMRLLADRFLKRVAITEVEEVGPTVRLRDEAARYDLDSGDRWVAEHILRFLPGNGRLRR